MGRIMKNDAFRLVFCLLLILSLSGCGNHHLKDPALDISNATLTEGLNPEEWLIRVPDDGKSHLILDEAYFIRAEDVSEIPAWLSERGVEEIYG